MLSERGYQRETFESISERLEAGFKQQFGDDLDLNGRSFASQLVGVLAEMFELVWQDVENVYYSAYRDTAEGVQLDALMPYSGTSRDGAVAAYGTVKFSGPVGATIEAGTFVNKKDETIYFTTQDVTIDADGTVTVDVMCQQSGIVGNADVGEINELTNPIEGVTVTNEQALTNGRERESDTELRQKSDLSVEGQGSSTTAAIRTEILKKNGVRAVFVDENYSDTVNAYNTPVAAVQAFVLGGLDEDIATAILDKRSAGIRPYGETIVRIKDKSGEEKAIGFTRAQVVTVYAKVQLVTNPAFEADGVEKVKTAIAKYIGGTDTSGNSYNGLNMGDSVILSKLIANIYKDVNGLDDVTVTLSTDNVSYNDSNIVLTRKQVAEITASAIEVTL